MENICLSGWGGETQEIQRYNGVPPDTAAAVSGRDGSKRYHTIQINLT